MSQALPVNFTFCEGNYRIEKILGRTNNGYSYLAKDISLDRLVAINEFFPEKFCLRNAGNHNVHIDSGIDMAFFEQLKGLFLKEAREMAKIDCPNVVQVHEAFEENSTAYYVTDYVEGQYLSEIVKDKGAISAASAVRYIFQLGDALKVVQSRLSRYLDARSNNVIISASTGLPVIMHIESFSVKSILEYSSSVLTVDGVLSQSAINLLQGAIQNPVQQLASTLYYLVSGQKLTYSVSTSVTSTSIVQFTPGFPTDLIQPINNAMTGSYQSLAEFLEELRNLCNSPTFNRNTESQKSDVSNDTLNAPKHNTSQPTFSTPSRKPYYTSPQKTPYEKRNINDRSYSNGNGKDKGSGFFSSTGIKILVSVILIVLITIGVIILVKKVGSHPIMNGDSGERTGSNNLPHETEPELPIIDENEAIDKVKELIFALNDGDITKIKELLEEDYYNSRFIDHENGMSIQEQEKNLGRILVKIAKQTKGRFKNMGNNGVFSVEKRSNSSVLVTVEVPAGTGYRSGKDTFELKYENGRWEIINSPLLNTYSEQIKMLYK